VSSTPRLNSISSSNLKNLPTFSQILPIQLLHVMGTLAAYFGRFQSAPRGGGPPADHGSGSPGLPIPVGP